MKKIEKEAKIAQKKSMSKKAFLEMQKSQRVVFGMNTGTRTHKSNKDYNRQKEKLSLKNLY